jgi:hypothetical protein
VTILLLIFCQITFAQKKNDKKYKEGYVIRFSDTITCRIYTGYQNNEIGHEVTFKYPDGRMLSYHPGSVIKGFGYLSDTGMVQYAEIRVPEYWINEQTNDKAYAEIVSDGHIRLYRYTKIKNSVAVLPVILKPGVLIVSTPKRDRSYFIKIEDDDSMYEVGHKNIIGSEYFEREEIVPFLTGQPQIMANVPPGEFIYIRELKGYLNRYNEWYKKRHNSLNLLLFTKYPLNKYAT